MSAHDEATALIAHPPANQPISDHGESDFPSEVARALLDDERLSDEEGGR